MRYWQADVNLGPARFLFGIRPDSREEALDFARLRLGDRTALLEILEIPPPADRG